VLGSGAFHCLASLSALLLTNACMTCGSDLLTMSVCVARLFFAKTAYDCFEIHILNDPQDCILFTYRGNQTAPFCLSPLIQQKAAHYSFGLGYFPGRSESQGEHHA
jgi:hypothetical protein